VKGGAAIWVVLPPEPASMGTNNRATNRQAESEAFFFCGEERLEYAFSVVHRKSNTAVRNQELDSVMAGLLELHNQAAVGSGDAVHGFAGVDDEVQHDLEQLHRVAVHGRKSAGNVCLQVSAGVGDDIMTKRDGVANDFGERDGLETRVIFSDEGLQM